MFNLNHGTKDAGNLWHTLLKDIIIQYGLICSTVDHTYVVKAIGNGEFMLVSFATNDLLVSCPNCAIFDNIVKHIQQNFEIKVQTGQVLKF